MNTFEIIRLIGDAPESIINRTENHLLTRMAIFGDREGKNIRPGIDLLIKQTKISRRSAVRAISSLVKKGILVKCKTRKNGTDDLQCFEIKYELLNDKNFTKKLSTEEHQPCAKLALGIENHVPKLHKPCAKLALGPCAKLAPTPYTPHILTNTTNIFVEQTLDDTVDNLKKKFKKPRNKKPSWKPQVLEVFQHWKDTLSHPGAMLDEKRTRRITKALEAGYTVERLKKAIGGIKKSAFHMGDNDDGKVYDGIHVIFRDFEQIEKFICIFDGKVAPRNKNGATASKSTFFEKRKEGLKRLEEYTEKKYPHLVKRFKGM